ncbi:MAG: glycosyltransferase family 4 protein [Alphaproteobacteria bacterium]|nr:glycosyltransferase family 4 protein [Alphaproteobacteria bacterium]
MTDPASRYPTVLQVLPALETGGVERGTLEVASAIHAAGGRAMVASAGGRLVPNLLRLGADHVTLPLASRDPWRIWRNAALLEEVIRSEKVDIVHARSRAPAWAAWLAAKRTRVPFVTTYHGTYSEGFPGKRWYNSVMARGTLVIAISGFIAELIQQRHGVPPARIRMIPRGVDVSQFEPAKVNGDRVPRLARAWRVEDGQPIILLPGRLTRWKGQGVLIQALARLRNTEAVVVLAGSDQGRLAYAEELAALARRLRVEHRVRIVGNVDDMPAALKLSDIVVNASTQPEAFGRVVIEGQAMARPVIATDHGGAVETVAHGVTGWRVRPNDPDELAGMLDQVLSQPLATRLDMGEQARAMVHARFTTAAMQAATLDVYREVLG